MSDATSTAAPGPTIGPYNTPLIRIINFLSLVTVFILNGYAFSIWGLIYFFLAAWGVYQLLPRSYDSPAINKAVVLATNLVIYLRLKIRYPAKTWIETLCIHTGFALYTSWTLGATLVNLWAVATTRDPKFIDQTIAVLVLLGALEIAISCGSKIPCWCWLNKDVEKLGPATLALAIILGVVGVGVAIVALVKGGLRRSGSEREALNKTPQV
ncbi:hypothetical protein BCR44DRAFT_1499297 [Catenaria anguillulae PL171]|uniref:Uncharacterized protein n=1 Tax=Catenaria anguillulae PL171 TaxID=765915 RepID=A0A1Y2HME3_9FUNG|nr:hypothetical protein BCR44DRAFT_1499297 [Catenaria anguillulae PL171]